MDIDSATTSTLNINRRTFLSGSSAVADVEVIARVPQANTLAYGLDVKAWIQEGVVDVLVPTSISHEQFWTNLDEFTAMIEGTSVQLYGGTTHTLAGSDLTSEEQDLVRRGYSSGIVRKSMTPEMYVERASEFYRAGYDGVYVFNHWRGTSSIGLIGDKVATEKWRTFTLPARWTHLRSRPSRSRPRTSTASVRWRSTDSSVSLTRSAVRRQQARCRQLRRGCQRGVAGVIGRLAV